MILILITNLILMSLCFRLLNSEIGNDPRKSRKRHGVFVCFRLLNSEIGNDHLSVSSSVRYSQGFRLLNSEIGNDLIRFLNMKTY